MRWLNDRIFVIRQGNIISRPRCQLDFFLITFDVVSDARSFEPRHLGCSIILVVAVRSWCFLALLLLGVPQSELFRLSTYVGREVSFGSVQTWVVLCWILVL